MLPNVLVWGLIHSARRSTEYSGIETLGGRVEFRKWAEKI
jgi:hypothetical protein